MKILFVSSAPLEYSSSSNMRNISLLKGLIENGNEVYTLTPEPQKESALYDEKMCKLEFKKRYFIPLGAIHSAVTMKKNKKSKIKDTIYNLLKKFKIYDFRSNLAKKEVKIDENFDIIISSSDPKLSHLIAQNLINKNKNITKKWIQYWGDPFATDVNKKSFVPKFLIKKEEKRLISLANVVLYVSPFTLEQQKNIYQKYKDKMIFLPIPYEKSIIYPKTDNEKLTLGYFGEYHSRNRNAVPLYDAIKEEKDKELYICGNSDLNLSECENIKIKDRQPIEVIRNLEKKSDILVCICNKKGTQIPGKIYHYSATNKPIMILLDGDNQEQMKKYFESYNRFIICKNEKEDILNAINTYMEEKKYYQPLTELSPAKIAKDLLNESEKIK